LSAEQLTSGSSTNDQNVYLFGQGRLEIWLLFPVELKLERVARALEADKVKLHYCA
jgi:hypothetical protein